MSTCDVYVTYCLWCDPVLRVVSARPTVSYMERQPGCLKPKPRLAFPSHVQTEGEYRYILQRELCHLSANVFQVGECELFKYKRDKTYTNVLWLRIDQIGAEAWLQASNNSLCKEWGQPTKQKVSKFRRRLIDSSALLCLRSRRQI